MILKIPFQNFEIRIATESTNTPRFDPRSTDNICMPDPESFLGDENYRPSSRYRVSVMQGDEIVAYRILLAEGGATGIHSHSAFLLNDTCYIAIGPFICVLKVPTLRLAWYIMADKVTCFGIYDAENYRSIISHGEFEISRFNYSGQLIWSSSGRDIFTGSFVLYEHHAEVFDFDDAKYRIELKTGRSKIIAEKNKGML